MGQIIFSVDLAKSVFQVAESRRPGVVETTKKLSRVRFATFFAKRKSATIVMEACGSSHHWGRELQKQGHTVVLLPPHSVRPYVMRNKTDEADAKGILEAYRNKDIHPVPVKSTTQQALVSLHRLRSRWVAARTARLNTVRGVLREFGMTIPLGASRVIPSVFAVLEDGDAALPDALRPVLAAACQEIRDLESRIEIAEVQMTALAREIPVVDELRAIPGFGMLGATALVSMVGEIRRFRSGRRFASYLGLTPREHSSGLVRRLGAMSKRGDTYLRMLLIHGARSVLFAAKRAPPRDRLRAWVLDCERRRGHNKAAVALANKMARIAWAVWSRGEPYREAATA